MRRAIIETATGEVTNFAEIDPALPFGPYDPGPRLEVIDDAPGVRRGDIWDGLIFTRPIQVKTPRELRADRTRLLQSQAADPQAPPLSVPELTEMVVHLAERLGFAFD